MRRGQHDSPLKAGNIIKNSEISNNNTHCFATQFDQHIDK